MQKTTPKGAVSAPPILQIENLEIAVQTKKSIKPLVMDLSFSLHAGETLAIAGESGSGKSLTSLAIMRLLAPPLAVTGGSIKFHGEDLGKLSDTAMRNMRGTRIAMIFQEPMTSLNPVLTIGTQLQEVLQAHESVSRSQARNRALEALKAVRISQAEKRLDQYPHQLSGGMRQRVMIAMALMLKPEILIADEPTTALDVTVQREVLDLLKDLQKELNTAIILITHDMGVVAETADRVIILQSGQKVESNTTNEIFSLPKQDYTKALLAAVPRMGNGFDQAGKTGPEIIARLDDVCVRFDIRGGILERVKQRVHAVEHVSLKIFNKETFALVGESGCGKSTIARAMVNLVGHTGKIEIAGKTVGKMTRQENLELRRHVQIIFQDPMAALDARMRVGDLIAEPLVIHKIGTAQEQRNAASELMQKVGLSRDQIDRYPHEFSGGQKQRICIARALALKPNLIIADESVSALDVSVQAQVLDLLESLKIEFGISYLFISHDMAVVENIADRVAVMYLGQIVEMGTKAQVFGNPIHPYTKRLIEAVPVPDPQLKRKHIERLTGDVPTPVFPVEEGPERVVFKDHGNGHLTAM